MSEFKANLALTATAHNNIRIAKVVNQKAQVEKARKLLETKKGFFSRLFS